jgi:acetate kinase
MIRSTKEKTMKEASTAKEPSMKPANPRSLTINCGSSSIKFALFENNSDMSALLDRETQDVRAAEAVALFCYQVKKWIGAFAAVLGGVDTLVFAGGIGENAPPVRTRICDGLGFLGIELEDKRNAASEDVISANASRVPVRVIHTDEEQMIARTVCRTLGLG